MSRALLSIVDSALIRGMLDACQPLIPPHPAIAAQPARPPVSALAPAPRTPRERARAQTVADIVRLGREHLAVHGAAALSLRAVARDLGVVSSAVYRYVENRDELLTLLLIDAYGELGDEVDAAVGRVAEADFTGRFQALGRAVRGWAIREPARYALLFGSPVPGYRAPAERTTGPGTRVIFSLMAIFDAAWRAGALGAEAAPAGGAPAGGDSCGSRPPGARPASHPGGVGPGHAR